MNIKYVECTHCKDKIFSFVRHDFKQCSCGKSALDGGFDYQRIMGTVENKEGLIKDLIKDIRESFIWKQIYDKNGNNLEKPIYIPLKDLKTDHIIGILKWFTGNLDIHDDGKSCNMNESWIAIHLVFLEELSYRESLKPKYHVPTKTHL